MIAVWRAIPWRAYWQGFLAGIRQVAPFALGAAAGLTALFLYQILNPPPQPLTVKQVNTVVAKAMASATPPPPNAVVAYRVIQPSLVLIHTSGEDENDEEDDGLGSGVLISDQGEILTALHVVTNTATIEVFFADGTEAKGKITSIQPEKDIATLQTDTLPKILVPAVMGNPGAMRVGDDAYAVGNPFGLYGSFSAGVISGLERSFKAEGTGQTIEGLMQIDTAVNPGNSGGPLLNRYGQVVGIVIGLLNPTQEKFFVGIGYAVPITAAAGGAGGRGPQY